MVSFQLPLKLLLLATVATEISACGGKCETSSDGVETCTFTAAVNIHAGELGYYAFEECGEEHNPTLEMKVGTTYVFDQSGKTNHMHPLGFAYYPGGAHTGLDELEPGIKPENSASKCADNMSCPAPMYFVDGKYEGKYSNIAEKVAVTTGEDDFGLDVYEPLFFHPLTQWLEKSWSVAVKFDIEDMDKDIFYFCHIHQYMSGRIKIIGKDGEKVSMADSPELGFEYDTPTDFDTACGTTNTDQYQLPADNCPDKFVCDVPSDNKSLMNFAACIEAMDCAMVQGITNYVKSNSEVALFIHQMIPHHQNAVNMANALLKTDAIECDDVTSEEPHCVMEEVARSIINSQNYQIQQMRAVLDDEKYESEDNESCDLTSTDSSSSIQIAPTTIMKIASVVVFLGMMN